MLIQECHFTVFADYHQFYLWDAGMRPMAPIDYSHEDVERRIKVGPNVFVIQPERNNEVHGTVEVHDEEPPLDSEGWDHVAEASLHLPTGQLAVEECTGGTVASLNVNPGWYRVRSFHGGWDTIDETGLEGDDHYSAVLWPAPEAELQVLKQGRSRFA